jgi:hypothetical protein
MKNLCLILRYNTRVVLSTHWKWTAARLHLPAPIDSAHRDFKTELCHRKQEGSTRFICGSAKKMPPTANHIRQKSGVKPKGIVRV